MKEIYKDILNHMETDPQPDNQSSYKIEYIKTQDGTRLPFIRPKEPKDNIDQTNEYTNKIQNMLLSQSPSDQAD